MFLLLACLLACLLAVCLVYPGVCLETSFFSFFGIKAGGGHASEQKMSKTSQQPTGHLLIWVKIVKMPVRCPHRTLALPACCSLVPGGIRSWERTSNAGKGSYAHHTPSPTKLCKRTTPPSPSCQASPPASADIQAPSSDWSPTPDRSCPITSSWRGHVISATCWTLLGLYAQKARARKLKPLSLCVSPFHSLRLLPINCYSVAFCLECGTHTCSRSLVSHPKKA